MDKQAISNDSFEIIPTVAEIQAAIAEVETNAPVITAWWIAEEVEEEDG